MRSFARLFVVALAGTRVADTKFVRGTVDTIQAWKYITRFCFTPLPHKARDATEERALKKYGRFDFEVRFPNGSRAMLLTFSSDASVAGRGFSARFSCSDNSCAIFEAMPPILRARLLCFARVVCNLS